MKTIDLADTSAAFGKYIHDINGETLVFKDHGKAVAALRRINDDDMEDIAVSEDPHFIEIMKRSAEEIRRGEVIPFEEVVRKYGTAGKPKPKQKKSRIHGKR